MFYLVNPSKLNKKKLHRNPELLIVNPFKKGTKNSGGKKMLKKAKRNPARRNPSPVASVKKVLNKDTAKLALIGGLGGGAAITAASALVGTSLGSTKAAALAVAVLGAVGASIVLDQAGERLHKPMLNAAAPAVALGALTLSVWELGRDPLLSAVSSVRSKLGLSSWDKEFSGLGQSYHDEFGRKGLSGFGAGPNPVLAPEDNPFANVKGMAGYERMGDIYNSQRLGSFEAESGLGSFAPEEANVMNQQIADQAKHAAGHYGGLGAATLFEPFIAD